MKSNLVVYQPYHVQLDSLIEEFCERCSATHYVYLVRPHSEPRDDSPSGVRFLNHPLDRLPRFGAVDAAIAVGDAEVAARLKESYPESKLAVWYPNETRRPLPDLMLSLLRPSVVRGNFGELEQRDFAQAI